MALITDINSSVMNSYVTAQEANTYFANRGHGETWEDIENPDAFLISATNQIDWFMNFLGSKVSSEQPLEWPRADCYDSKNQAYVPIDVIPTKVKHAVLELAIASLDEDRLADSDMAGLQEVKVGSLKVVSNLVGPWQETKKPIPPVIYRILSGIITNSSSMFRRTVRT